MKTVLITGVGGFLGRHAAQLFRREGWRVVGIDEIPVDSVESSDIEYHRLALPNERLPELLRTEAPQICVHAAGCASVGLSMEDPSTDFRGNTVLVFEVLEALRRNAPTCRFVLLSSAAVYGDPVSLPVAEDQTVSPLSPYGYHKRQAELLCEEYSRIHGLPTVALRIFSAYGPGLRRQVVWDICEKILTTGQLTLRGSGGESRDFVHAKDIARGIWIVAENAPCHGELYNLAAAREVTITELARLLLAALGAKGEPRFDGRPSPGNPLRWLADTSKIAALGFAPTIPFEDGIAEVAAWSRSKIVGR